MTRMLFFLVILVSQLDQTIPLASASPEPIYLAASGRGFQPIEFQDGKRLTVETIEQLLLEAKMDDEILALEIRRSGIDFRLTPEKLDRLMKAGIREKAKQALQQKEELVAYDEFSREKNAARRLSLGQGFLQNYPRSTESAKIAAELRKAELDVFEEEFRRFSDNPGLAGLEKFLTSGGALLQQRSDTLAVVQVTSRLALATGKGMIGDFYSDLERSREYANEALKLLETPTPPPGIDPQAYSQLRTNNLGPIYQSLGLYLIRQPVPDSEQGTKLGEAINFLTKAAETNGPSSNDPVTYWLRAQARDQIFQKLGEEYRAMPKGQRVGRQGQSLCAGMAALTSQLILDYTQVVSLSSRADSSQSSQLSQLKDEAIKAINLLATSDRPCLGGRGGLIDELPDEEKRAALIIGVEDYRDKQAGKFNYAAADAREVAMALIQYGGFRKEQVVLLATGEPAEREPVRSVILQQLGELPNRVPPDGLLLIYFAGHNFERDGKSYLLAADSLTSQSLLADTAISVEQLREKILASGAEQVILIFDSFRQAPVSENFARGLSFAVRKNEVMAFATLLSASAGQHAYESPSKKRGVFTSALLEASQGKATTKARGVTLEDLIKYLENTVSRDAGASGEQRPDAVVEGYEKEDLVLFQPTNAAQAEARKDTPSDLIRKSKTIQVRGKTVWMNEGVLEAELRKVPDFQNLKLTFAEEGKEPDLLIEIKLPFMTWNWNYTVTHRPSNTVLFSGKRRGTTDSSVSPELARILVTRLLELRK